MLGISGVAVRKPKAAKPEIIEHEHLQWLVNSRTANQHSALRLLVLLDTHSETIKKNKDYSTKAQLLVAVCFSLWRAAFLADKTGKREAVFQDARAFLGKMLMDNAITYPQDRASREWTFNYYMNSAKDCLLILARDWPAVENDFSVHKKVVKGTTAPRRRWDRHQKAFETAVKSFQKALER